jgi:hypothetical protein
MTCCSQSQRRSCVPPRSDRVAVQLCCQCAPNLVLLRQLHLIGLRSWPLPPLVDLGDLATLWRAARWTTSISPLTSPHVVIDGGPSLVLGDVPRPDDGLILPRSQFDSSGQPFVDHCVNSQQPSAVTVAAYAHGDLAQRLSAAPLAVLTCCTSAAAGSAAAGGKRTITQAHRWCSRRCGYCQGSLASFSSMESLAMSAAAWSAGAAWATFAVLAITLYFVYRQVAEATRLRRDQARPYVVVSIDVEQRQMFMLVVENVGSTPAFDVKIEFDKPLRSTMKEIEQVRMLREPSPMLPPGRKFRATWEVAHEVFDGGYPYPLSYKATANYKDASGRCYGPETYFLDFRAYEGQAVGLKGLNELANSLDALQKVHKKWTNGTSGLLVHNIDLTRKIRREDRPYHFMRMKQAYVRSGWRAAIGYWIGIWRRRYGLRSR